MGGVPLDEFIAVTVPYEKAETPRRPQRPIRYSDKRETDPDAPLGEPDPGPQILTIHGSKGLEWDGVVVLV